MMARSSLSSNLALGVHSFSVSPMNIPPRLAWFGTSKLGSSHCSFMLFMTTISLFTRPRSTIRFHPIGRTCVKLAPFDSLSPVMSWTPSTLMTPTYATCFHPFRQNGIPTQLLSRTLQCPCWEGADKNEETTMYRNLHQLAHDRDHRGTGNPHAGHFAWIDEYVDSFELANITFLTFAWPNYWYVPEENDRSSILYRLHPLPLSV